MGSRMETGTQSPLSLLELMRWSWHRGLMKVFLVTASAFPDGEDGGGLLSGAFAQQGMEATWVEWDDRAVDWGSADLVVVRATWDYVERHAEFLAWVRQVEAVTPVLNGADVFTWNSDKAYLAQLAEAGLDVVPTRVLASEGDLAAAVQEWGQVVVKPRVGAGGVGVQVVDACATSLLPTVPCVAQPLVESVRSAGEMSVYVVGGAATGQVRKVPPAGEILVHEHLGGAYTRVPLDPALQAASLDAVRAAQDLVGRRLPYARVDFLLLGDRWRVSELELIEPSLYLDLVPENADALALAAVDQEV